LPVVYETPPTNMSTEYIKIMDMFKEYVVDMEDMEI